MKLSVAFCSACGLLLLASLSKLHAVPNSRLDNLLLEKVAVPRATNVDDYLIELARNAGVNMLADATALPPPATLQPFPETLTAMFTDEAGLTSPKAIAPTLIDLIIDLTQQQKLSHLRFDKTTFLFWSEPDVESDLAQARRLAAGGGVPIPVTPGQPQPGQSLEMQFKAQTGALLADYLRREHGWKGEVADPPLTIKFADLPEALRHNLTTLTLQRLLVSTKSDDVWLTDKPWAKAVLQIRPTPLLDHGRRYTQRLTVASNVDGGQQSIAFYIR